MPIQRNVLDEDLSDVETSISFRTPTDLEPKVFWNPQHFLDHLHTFPHVEVLTYSCSEEGLWYCQSILRLVVCRGVSKVKKHPDIVEVRYARNIHTKLYLCYNRKQSLDSAFVGSLNLTAPTQLNIMCALPSSAHEQALAYFNAVWKQCKP